MSQIRRPVPLTSPPSAVGSAPPLKAKLPVYARLAKLDIFDYYLSVLVVWSLLAPAERLDVRSLLTLAVFLLGAVCVVAATVTFDDVTGYRDGSDAVNYGPDAPARRLARKPLLAGSLSPAEAVRFGWAMAAAGTLLWAVAVVIAPRHPPWAVALTALCLASAVQYSWGVKLSYHGFQEAILAGFGMAVVLAPYGLISEGSRGFAFVQALLFGLGPLLFGVYSNTNDIPGDRKVGRPTIAATLSPRANAAFIGALSLSEALIIVGSALIRVAPWWFPLAMLPVVALRAVQMVTGLRRGDILAARRLGIRIHRTAVALLVLVNILYPLVGRGAS